jgi:hypothetical protein
MYKAVEETILSQGTRKVRGKILVEDNKEFRKARYKVGKDDKFVLVEVAVKLLGKYQQVLVGMR